MKKLCLRPFVEIELSEDGQPLLVKMDWSDCFESVWDTETEEHDYFPSTEHNDLANRMVFPDSVPFVIR